MAVGWVESRDFSLAEIERTACKAEQIHKETTIFTQNGPRLSFWVKIVATFGAFKSQKEQIKVF